MLLPGLCQAAQQGRLAAGLAAQAPPCLLASIGAASAAVVAAPILGAMAATEAQADYMVLAVGVAVPLLTGRQAALAAMAPTALLL